MASRKIKLIVRVVYNFYCYIFAVALLVLFLSWFAAAPFLNAQRRRLFLLNIIDFYLRALFFLIYIKIEKKGILKEGQYIYVANHTSYLDVLVAFRLLKNSRNFYFLGRADMCRIPVFGFFYKQVVIPLNRDSLQDRIDNLQKLNEKLNKGNSIFIFPEATFNNSKNVLLPFKKGAFKLSFDTKVDILPIVLLDGKKRMNSDYKFSLTPGKFRAIILEPMNTSEYHSHEELRKSCVDIFEKWLNGFFDY